MYKCEGCDVDNLGWFEYVKLEHPSEDREVISCRTCEPYIIKNIEYAEFEIDIACSVCDHRSRAQRQEVDLSVLCGKCLRSFGNETYGKSVNMIRWDRNL